MHTTIAMYLEHHQTPPCLCLPASAETPDGLNAFILSSKSEHLTIKTASPPDPPHNVGVSATTCNSLNVAWDPPLEHGSEVIGQSWCPFALLFPLCLLC